ncbi:MAG: hypothetical protein IPJ83_05470 [Saprospiraceae bacterium]|nr:hypothetical protein [Candidatus Vicinibacter proximus]
MVENKVSSPNKPTNKSEEKKIFWGFKHDLNCKKMETTRKGKINSLKLIFPKNCKFIKDNEAK